MDQQTGGMARARGPGETASELLARKLDGRLEELKKALRRLDMAGSTQRQERARAKRIVLVGYTNAGKTSLMNALTSAGLSARDVPFETLDTTSRCLTRHGGDVVLSDTVGFIRRLPDRLLASFESTLAELAEASLLVLVVDASDRERALHLQTSEEVLGRVGAAAIPRFYVFNKEDRLGPDDDRAAIVAAAGGHPYAVLASHDANAVLALRDALLARARESDRTATVLVPYDAGEVLALVYGRCRVVASEATDAGLRLQFEGPAPVVARVHAQLTRRSA
jgi:GTP-binding protein HflX